MTFEYDLKIKTAMRDQMPKESNIPFNNGDSVIYFDNKIKRKRVGNIIAQEVTSTRVSRGAGIHKVATRELQHNTAQRMEETDNEQASASSDAESIPEAIPRQKKRKTKKEQKEGKTITEPSKKEVLRWQKTKDAEEQQREEEEGRDRVINETPWSEDEGPVTEPVHPQMMQPRRYEHVKF